jgi:hypothetical protein
VLRFTECLVAELGLELWFSSFQASYELQNHKTVYTLTFKSNEVPCSHSEFLESIKKKKTLFRISLEKNTLQEKQRIHYVI